MTHGGTPHGRQIQTEAERLRQERDFWKRTAGQFKQTGLDLLDENDKLRKQLADKVRDEALHWLALALADDEQHDPISARCPDCGKSETEEIRNARKKAAESP